MAIVFDTYDATVESINLPTPQLRVLTFRLDKKVTFTAGQYMSMIVPESTPVPFSIASSPEDHDHLQFGIHITGGPHTSKIATLRQGDKVLLRGPFGRFVLNGEKRIAFLAGGVGVTPFMSMLRWIRDTNSDIEATLFYSAKNKDELLWKEELYAMIAEHPNIKVILTITQDATPEWQLERGRIDAPMMQRHLPNPQEVTYYCCGPENFITAMRNNVIALGVKEEQFLREKW